MILSEQQLRENQIHKLESISIICKYSCATIELQRGMKNIFCSLENKFLLSKMKAFFQIRKCSKAYLKKRIKQLVGEKINRMNRILTNKIFNHKATAILSINQFSQRKRKLKKYQDFQEQVQINDPNYNAKRKQLQRLTRKYNRLLSQFSLLCHKSTKKLKD